MKNIFVAVGILVGTLLSVNAIASKINTSDLTLVKENHAVITVNGVRYVLDSYIKPFQRPYHVLITRYDKAVITHKVAIKVVTDYIKPRGCTAPITRRPDLDKHNTAKTQWLIGIAC